MKEVKRLAWEFEQCMHKAEEAEWKYRAKEEEAKCKQKANEEAQ